MRRRTKALVGVIVVAAVSFFIFVPVIGTSIPACFNAIPYLIPSQGSLSFILFGFGGVVYGGQYQWFSSHLPFCHF